MSISEMLYSYGYYGLFIILLFEGLGLPLPIQLAFMATAYLIHIDTMSTLPVIVIATVGNLSGNIIAYYLGYYGGGLLVSYTYALQIFKVDERRVDL